ncbi:MAG: hypothetical protein ABI614_16360 [Planctomycetota bacterium]
MQKQQLTIESILQLADEHHARTGRWPKMTSGVIPNTEEKWQGIDGALRAGRRGLDAGQSLARLLAAHRNVRNHCGLPKLSNAKILRWADAHRAATGEWPHGNSGPVHAGPDVSPGETWRRIADALRIGIRGLSPGYTLRQLLTDKRGRTAYKRLTVAQILRWADAHKQRTGSWPAIESGCVAESPKDTWAAINAALKNGRRGFPGGSSLSKLLLQKRKAWNKTTRPKLTIEKILMWADAHHRKTGEYPSSQCGAVSAAAGESWNCINWNLLCGGRGVGPGTSLARLLSKHRGVALYTHRRSRKKQNRD